MYLYRRVVIIITRTVFWQWCQPRPRDGPRVPRGGHRVRRRLFLPEEKPSANLPAYRVSVSRTVVLRNVRPSRRKRISESPAAPATGFRSWHFISTLPGVLVRLLFLTRYYHDCCYCTVRVRLVTENCATYRFLGPAPPSGFMGFPAGVDSAALCTRRRPAVSDSHVRRFGLSREPRTRGPTYIHFSPFPPPLMELERISMSERKVRVVTQ